MVGQTVTVTYSVSPQFGGTPTGNVTVSDGTNSCMGTVAAGQCNLALTTAGARTLTATYVGDTNFNGSASAGASHQVDKANTTTTITAESADPTNEGESFTVFYSVAVTAPGAGTPSGTVTVSDGVNSCMGTVAAGQCSLALTTVGNRTLTATYAGNASFNGSASAGEPHTVLPIVVNTTTAITSDSPDPSLVGQNVTVSYTVMPQSGSGTPAGNVTVSDGVDSCTATVAAGECTLALTTVGARTLTATYAGNANFNGSMSAGEPHTVNQAPAITSANSTTFVVGSNGSFTVTATGSPTPTLSMSGMLPGGVTFTPATGVLSGTPAAGTGGTYALVFTASNGAGSDATQNFTLTVNEAPAITSADSATFTEGNFGSFTVSASGFPAPTFSASGTLPSGVTLSSSGVLSGTPAAGSGGAYPITITASNGVGSDAQQSFTLNVTAAVCSAPPADAISWFAAEGNAKDLLGANDGSFTGTAAYAPGKVGQAFSFAGSSFVSVPANSGSLNLTGSAVTIEGWINPTATAGAVYFGKTQSGANDYLLLLDAGQLTAIIKAGGSEKIVRGFTDYPTNSMPLIPTPGQWTHLALTYDGALIKLYANGVQVGQDTKTGNLAGSASPFNIGGRTGSLFFNGQIDEVDVYSRALEQSEIAAHLQLQPGGQMPAGFLAQQRRLAQNARRGWPVRCATAIKRRARSGMPQRRGERRPHHRRHS